VIGWMRNAGAGPVHRDPLRVVAFSDAVCAITITLLVLEIRPRLTTRPFYWLPIRGESP
jgi:uncharacterized membrane protein